MSAGLCGTTHPSRAPTPPPSPLHLCGIRVFPTDELNPRGEISPEVEDGIVGRAGGDVARLGRCGAPEVRRLPRRAAGIAVLPEISPGYG
jgi:hypothetical protein